MRGDSRRISHGRAQLSVPIAAVGWRRSGVSAARVPSWRERVAPADSCSWVRPVRSFRRRALLGRAADRVLEDPSAPGSLRARLRFLRPAASSASPPLL